MKTKNKRAELKLNVRSRCYSFKAFRKQRTVAVFSTRKYRMNFKSGTLDALTIAHRKTFCDLNRVDFDNVVCLEQVHGANIVRVGENDRGRGTRSNDEAIKGTDALLTNLREVGLAIRTADCAPLFFLDTKKKAIGMAHVGWRGASERLSSKMVQAFRRQFLSKPENIIVGIGPMIRPCCYEVGDEFRGTFGAFVVKRNTGFYFDLPGWIFNELKQEGIAVENIHDSQICTACSNDEFPSYRKEGDKVRHMWSVMMLHV